MIFLKNLSNNDSIFNSDVVDSDVERSMGTARSKEKGKKNISPKKEKGGPMRSFVSKTASKIKRPTKKGNKGPVQTPRLQRPQKLRGYLLRGLVPQERPLYLLRRAEVYPKRQGKKS